MNIDPKKPLLELTVEEFMDLQKNKTQEKKYEYGLKGLAKTLGCSRSKAAEIKSSGILDDAIIQNGHLIIIDKEKAMELMALHKKMNASELTEKFWEYNEKEPLGAVAVALYLFLIEVWKKNEENDFSLSDTEICERLKITRPTIIVLRQKLVNAGMIHYQPKNGLPGHYKIHFEYSPKLSVFANLETNKGKSTNTSSQKEISKKRKITEKSSQKIEDSKNENLSSDDLTEKPITIPISLPSNIPSLEEFTQYAKLLNNYVPEMDHLIKEKYDSWLGNGWKNGYDKPITNWKSSIKNIMPFLESELQSSNATSQKIALPTIKRPKSSIDE